MVYTGEVLCGMRGQAGMTDLELIGYCDLHCETELALFRGDHINRMIELAGHPSGFVARVDPTAFIGAHAEMKELCRLARDRLSGRVADKPRCRVIPFPTMGQNMQKD